jgi:hypothetical protein
MTRLTLSLALLPLFLVGCSSRATQTQLREPHQHVVVNTIRPGNAHGNSVTLGEEYARAASESAALASSDGTTTPSSSADTDQPFASLSPGESASEWSAAPGAEVTPELALGVESSVGAAEPEPVEETVAAAPATETVAAAPAPAPAEEAEAEEPLPVTSAPATVVSNTSPTWSEISQPEPAPAPTYYPALTSEQVYAAAASLEGLSGWTVVPFAHFTRERRHVVVVWPALNSSGRTVDAMVVGVCLEEAGDGALEQCGSRWVVSDSAAAEAALVNALGGADYEIVSEQQSAALADLGPRLAGLGNQFVGAANRGDRRAASDAATAFAQMLPAEQTAFDNDLAQLLWAGAQYNGRLEHVRTERSGSTATLTFSVRRSIITLQTVRVTARQVSAGSSEWVVVDYQ